VTDTVGMPTMNDIMNELAKPGRDPRSGSRHSVLPKGFEKIEDVRPGMKLPALSPTSLPSGFVDIGVHQDGLVHISEISDGYVKSPSESREGPSEGDGYGLEVDLQRKRISLSLKSESQKERKHEPAESKCISPGQT